jgi:release factor glutamine methyltransferase
VKLGEITNNFFKENQAKLEQNYPGINLNKIKCELYELLTPHFLDTHEFFYSPYVSIANHPINIFFLALSKGTPLEYISGKKYFYESEFLVSPDVLIPRNETEILVEKAIEELKMWYKKTDEVLKVCDIGTGSGCIPISILRGFGKPLKVLATDISNEALKIAQKNNFNLRYSYPVVSECRFKCMDLLEGSEDQFHLITSNPPYIKEESDEKLIHQQVFEYEPHLALFIKDKIYDDWFFKLFQDVHRSLYKEGVFIMEGHEHHLKKLEAISHKLNWTNTEIINDYCDRNRFLILRK